MKLSFFSRHADGRVDHLLAVLVAFGAVLGRQIDILKAAPAADVQAEDVLEVVPLLDPLVHHLGEGGPAFGVQARLAGVGELLDDLDAVLLGPFADLVPLNGDRVLLPVLGRVAIVGHGPHLGAGAASAVPISHQCVMVVSFAFVFVGEYLGIQRVGISRSPVPKSRSLPDAAQCDCVFHFRNHDLKLGQTRVGIW